MGKPTVLRSTHNRVVVLTLNRPRARNAIDIATIKLLGEHVAELACVNEARVIVITGAGDQAFSSGGDIGEMTTFSPLSADQLMTSWQIALENIERSPKPVIAAINGFALGGGTELAMACHIRVASDDARLGQPEIALDHLPGGGGTQRLPRLVPTGLAYEYLLTGDPIPAAEAWRIGLVNHVWPKAQFMDRALAFADRIAARAPVAVRYTLEAVREGLKGPLEVGLRLERAMAGLVIESPEARQGLHDFLARKKDKKGTTQLNDAAQPKR
jgi:enoyl-CoA hydratase